MKLQLRLSWIMVFWYRFFVSPLSFYMVWCNPEFGVITSRLLSWTQILSTPHITSATFIPKRSKPASVGRDRLAGHCNRRCTVAALPFDLSRTITVCVQSLQYPVHSCVSWYRRTGNNNDLIAIPEPWCTDSRCHSIKRRSCTLMHICKIEWHRTVQSAKEIWAFTCIYVYIIYHIYIICHCVFIYHVYIIWLIYI